MTVGNTAVLVCQPFLSIDILFNNAVHFDLNLENLNRMEETVSRGKTLILLL